MYRTIQKTPHNYKEGSFSFVRRGCGGRQNGIYRCGVWYEEEYQDYKNVDENWITPTLTEIFAGNQSLARSFVEHKEVKGVWKEISEIFTGLSKSTGSTLTDYSSSQRVAYLYQHAEAEMLKVMIRFVGKSLVCPNHDAVVIISPLTIRQIRMMEDKIQQTCGFDVSLTQRMV